ncbi:MAG: class I SAM-dependent methyltransferase [Candidatus Bathyarchaeota archaeon]|nr:MAG: class I SAM-dependent methyltransferase [Candidatus Bathyarchaeota archaeon]
MPDAFGKVFMAHHRGKQAKYIIERDDGLVDELDGKDYFMEYEEWPQHERDALTWAKGRVLDVGCGAGRVALWFQERGHEVVGIDLSLLAVEVSRERGVGDCREMDARRLDFPEGRFDTVIMFGNNLGIAGGFEETRIMLEGFHRVTCEDGVIIASTRAPLTTDNPVHLAYHEQNMKRGRPPGLVRIRVGFQGEFDDWFELLMVEEEELVRLLEPTGWALERIYWSEGSNYTAILTKKS